ncbi:metallopeptidase family M24 [Phlyctema vagabunda]|uniref:Xaa-Pro aminopeptidase n=1 Tax=Phlyctema vagabunda TaxID=108571 RepID=A0ABR4P7G3_9HELO
MLTSVRCAFYLDKVFVPDWYDRQLLTNSRSMSRSSLLTLTSSSASTPLRATFPIRRLLGVTCERSSLPTYALRPNPYSDSRRPVSRRHALHTSTTSLRRFEPDTKMASVETILAGKYPAKSHAKRVAEYIQKKDPSAAGVLYLEGQKTKMIEDNDEAEPFRQRRFFYYMTGCDLPDSYYLYDLGTGKSTLFIPPVDPEHVIWTGLPVSESEALALYDIDHVQTSDVVNAALATTRSRTKIWAINKQVSDHITFLSYDEKDFALLKEAIEECRVVKDEYEVALTKKANAISTIGHTAILDAVKHAKNERELEALFIQKSIANGAREQAYHSIVASGTAAATLHYMKNYEPLEGKLNLLLDAGAEYKLYASDITRTFPISGKFSTESRAIYDIVLKMQEVCINMLKEGVVWDDVHLEAHKIAIDGLLALGVLQGSKEDILKSRTSVAFFPHGLGHYLGMDTHDTGGHPNYEDKDTLFRYLRVRGKLPAGSIVTVEPGIYFCRFIIEPYLKDPVHASYINADVLAKYWDVGGVRIEDNILITKDGYENLTTAIKDVAEMEKHINGV